MPITKTENNLNQTVDLMVGVISILIIYGNFILVGLISGLKDLISFNNPFDEIFVISLGGLLGLSGIVLSFGKTSKKDYKIIISTLIMLGIFTACYVIYSLYTEPDSPDSFYEKITLFPLFGSVIVGLRRLYNSMFNT